MCPDSLGTLDQYCEEVKFILQDFIGFMKEQVSNSEDRFLQLETSGQIDENSSLTLKTNVSFNWKKINSLIDEFLSCDENVRE